MSRASELYKRLSVFDGVVSSMLSRNQDTSGEVYEKLVRTFGDRVLLKRMASSASVKRFQEFNCDRMLIDCYAHWRDSIHPVDLRESIIETNPGWRAMDKFCHQKRRLLSSPSRTDIVVLSHIEDSTLYDFYPIIIRTPIRAPQHRLYVHTIQGTKGLFAMSMGNTMQEIADNSIQSSLDDPLSGNSKSSGEVNRVHLSYFRYLIAKKKFALHIVDIVEAVSANLPTSLNDSNVTLIDPPTQQKRGRRRRSSITSSLDLPIVSSNRAFDPLDLFTIHCLNFFCSFGSGLLVKISNDIVNAFVSPTTEYMRLLISTKSVQKAPTESHSVIRKYLARSFLESIRALIADRVHGETPEDACLSFLFRSEICFKSTTCSFRVISSLVFAAVRFIIAETREDVTRMSYWRRKISGKSEFETKTKLLEWLSILGVSNEVGPACSSIISSPLMLTMIKEFRHDLELVYREISGPSEFCEWELELQKRVKNCERLAKTDLRLLITTANGMGISPAPLTEEPSGIDLTVLNDDTQNDDPPAFTVSIEPSREGEQKISNESNLITQLMEELRNVKEEIQISKRNSEILYMELSRVKHKIAMDEENHGPDEKFSAS